MHSYVDMPGQMGLSCKKKEKCLLPDIQLSCVETSKPFILTTPRTKGNFSSDLVSVNKSEYSELFNNSYIWLE